MSAQRLNAIAIVMAVFLGLCPVTGWADPLDLTDVEMDEIYAKGIFVDLNINISMPNGSNLVMPGIEVPIPNMSGNASGRTIGTMSVVPANSASNGSSSNAASSVAAVSTRTPTASTLVVPTTTALGIGDNSMTNNSGLIITAPGAAVSIILNVAVFNNSTLDGDFFQSANSKVDCFSFAFNSFSF